jgi:hypothetical protein
MSASREVKCKEYRLLVYTIGGTEFVSVRDGRNETIVVGIPGQIVANERVPGDVKECVAVLIREGSPPSDGLVELGLRLYDNGFNVVPVDSSKKPLASWAFDKRIVREELEALLKKAGGIAIVGGPENPFRGASILVLIDVDRPSVLNKSPFLKELANKTVSWATGPRCPRCESKDLEVLEKGKKFKCNECKTEFSIEESRRGIGLLVAVGLETYEKHFGGTVRGKDVEFLVKNYQLIPPSMHPSGVRYEWINPIDFSRDDYGIYTMKDEELEQLLRELGVIKTKDAKREAMVEGGDQLGGGGLRELGDSDIIKIKELLKEAYKPGVRQHIWLFLSGWTAKAGISPISAAKILKMLYEETEDEEPLKMRAGAIVYSYKKAGIDLTQYTNGFEALFGVKPYGLEKEINEEEIKGRTGLQEILEGSLGEERALEIIKEISDIFNSASPYRDAIIEIMDYEKQLYAVANLRKLITCRARRDNDKLVYKERVVIGAPTEVAVYINPIGGVTKYQVKWEASTRPKPLIIGPCLLDEIIDRLKAEGLVISSRLVGDVIAAVIEGFIRRGKAMIKTEIESPGFYIVDGKLQAVSVEVKEPGPEELKEALLLLNELASKWFNHMLDKFATVIKWGAIAPFIYAYKQRGRWVKWLYLYGSSKTGKTTLSEIATIYLWGLEPTKHHKTGANIDTPARLGYFLSQSTFPVIIREPKGALDKDEIVEIIKASVEGLTARGKFHRGAYTDIPALAPLVFTSNKYIPRDDALLRRLKVLQFTYGERVPEERVKEFESKVKPELKKLKAIGDYIASYFLKNGLGEDLEKQGEEVLKAAYKSVGLEPPGWLELEAEANSETEVYEDLREQVRVFLVKRINEEYNRFVGRITVERPDGIETISRQEADLDTRVKIVLEKQLIPWLIKKDNEVLITTGIMQELEKVIGDIGGLKSLAELLEWEYDSKYTWRERKSVRGLVVIKVDLEDFINFLNPT